MSRCQHGGLYSFLLFCFSIIKWKTEEEEQIFKKQKGRCDSLPNGNLPNDNLPNSQVVRLFCGQGDQIGQFFAN
jgi:hypothetical protein